MSATTTAIATEPQLRPSHQYQQSCSAPAASLTVDTDPDDIVEASRLADANVPEGGEGWIVIAGCATLTWWYLGMSYSWGIMQAALVERELASASTLSWVGALCVTFNSIGALVWAKFIRMVGTRQAALFGIICLGGGCVLSGFCTGNVGGLFFTSGVLMGLGTSLCFLLVSVTPAQYFNKKRGTAIGIIYAAGGLGGTALTLAMSGLIQRVGPAWTFRIFGFMILATGVPAALVIKERVPIRKNAFIDKGLLRNSRFLTLMVAGGLSTFYLLVAPFFLPLYCTTIGLSQTAGAALVAAFNLSSAIGRLGCGISCDKFGPVNTLFFALLLNALTLLLVWPFSTSVGPLAVFVVLNGVGNGSFFSAMPPVVSSLFGSLRMPVVMGMIITGWGPGYLLGAPIAGYLLAAYGGEHGSSSNYHPAIFFAGAAALASCLLVGVVRVQSSKGLLSKI
ncbi:putative monocarboxylate transporter [Microdochium trichocladiopsis]|uniref:Monocarboxylate transporter n=1 Tax=Microdochium trichocladiopsis TaxID=1682393 RepID=A0A9P9BND3_9PEZI|nr:putative monocarboxylate transporter [Microdochium trichocladiopsis]KAH7027596.1 putative monocarboxylate transporter [Microdochium trichocladiopsis]